MRSTGPKAAVYQIAWKALTKPFDMPPADERAGERKERLVNVSPSLMPDAVAVYVRLQPKAEVGTPKKTRSGYRSQQARDGKMDTGLMCMLVRSVPNCAYQRTRASKYLRIGGCALRALHADALLVLCQGRSRKGNSKRLCSTEDALLN